MAALRSNGAILGSAYCAQEAARLDLWIDPCSCISAASNYITATASADDAADADDRDDDGVARFTLDHASVSFFGSRDLILRDAIAGSEIAHLHPKVFRISAHVSIRRCTLQLHMYALEYVRT
jgi:hypothetical protein